METTSVDEQTGIMGWVFATIAFIGTLLSSIIAMFYKKQSDGWDKREAELQAQISAGKASADAKIKMLESRADSCEEDRNELRVSHAVLIDRYSRLEKRVSDVESNKKNRDSIG